MVFLSPVFLYASDPFTGTWKLDVGRSRYTGACPKQMTITMTAKGNGVHYHSETLWSSGRPLVTDYTAAYDEKPATVTASQGAMLPVSLRRTASNSVTAMYKRGTTAIATSRRVISPDGKVMTITTVAADATGKKLVNVGVYQRVPAEPAGNVAPSKSGPGQTKPTQ